MLARNLDDCQACTLVHDRSQGSMNRGHQIDGFEFLFAALPLQIFRIHHPLFSGYTDEGHPVQGRSRFEARIDYGVRSDRIAIRQKPHHGNREPVLRARCYEKVFGVDVAMNAGKVACKYLALMRPSAMRLIAQHGFEISGGCRPPQSVPEHF